MNNIGWYLGKMGWILMIGVMLWLFVVTLPYIWWIWLFIIGAFLVTMFGENKKSIKIKEKEEDVIDLDDEIEKDKDENKRNVIGNELVESLNNNVGDE